MQLPAQANKNINIFDAVLGTPIKTYTNYKPQYIPLHLNTMRGQWYQLYHYLFNIRRLCNYSRVSLDGPPVKLWRFELTPTSKKWCMEQSGLSRNTFNKVWNAMRPELMVGADEWVTLMPVEVFDSFMHWIRQLTPREKHSWCKLYFYLYYNCMRFLQSDGGWGHSVELIAAEIGVDKKDVCAKIQKLEEEGWICRSDYKKKDTARFYYLPKHLETF